GIHQNLDDLVQKHVKTDYRKPYQEHNLEAFYLLQKQIKSSTYQNLILDSCCGTAMSSFKLAEQNPSSLIVGVDQSIHRLSKDGNEEKRPDNCLLLRANCEDLWRLCLENNITFEKHYILYPNPWPKSVHLKRRWHGHPVFPVLKNLAKRTELRSNWRLYLEEFAVAWKLLTSREFTVDSLKLDVSLTLFEKKYSASGQALYQLIVE
ncbi:MAG: hypothetical protein OQJ89_03265, partial [Kangiellaceae bacterium]|nr:hypothetical protein [Kangiellaceae bacterium]